MMLAYSFDGIDGWLSPTRHRYHILEDAVINRDEDYLYVYEYGDIIAIVDCTSVPRTFATGCPCGECARARTQYILPKLRGMIEHARLQRMVQDAF